MLTLPTINRRHWLALQSQKHRLARQHRLPVPVLRAAYPTLLQWDWDLPNPYKWLVYWSHSTEGPWNFISDYWHYGDSRQFAPDGGSDFYFIVGVDINGNEVTARSNAVRPDDVPMPDTLLDGLHEFYRPPATSQVFVNSHGETAAFDDDPFVGLPAPFPAAGSGYEDEEVWYRVIAFRDESGVRKYASLILSLNGGYVDGGGSIEWPAWGEWAEWPTGFLVVKAGTDQCREISKATMVAGWVDDNTGWGAGPVSYAAPPSVPKTLWRRSGEGTSADGIIQTVASPLGGNAFDLTSGGHLARQLADDALSRSNDITIAYWVCPDYTGHTSMWLGGSWTWHFIGEQFDGDTWSTTPPPDVNFNGVDGLHDTMTNCQYADWFLVVQRGNTMADTLTQDVWRLRDGLHQRTVATLSECSTNPLTGPSDYYVENELSRVLAFGSGYWWGNTGASYVDRMGTWTRPLTDEEIFRLWNLGLGWAPN